MFVSTQYDCFLCFEISWKDFFLLNDRVSNVSICTSDNIENLQFLKTGEASLVDGTCRSSPKLLRQVKNRQYVGTTF